MKIPKSLHHYFWDVDVAKLDPIKKKYFVINRLLDKGGLEAARWVRLNYTSHDITYTLTKLRDYSLRNASFWAIMYHVPLTKVKCFQEPYHTSRKTLWPY